MGSAVRKSLKLFCLAALAALIHVAVALPMDIIVSMPTGQTVIVKAEPEQTVADVKNFVYNVTEIHTINQRMYKGDKELDDSATLASYKISDRDTLVVRYGSRDASVKPRQTGKIVIIVIVVALIIAIALKLKKILAD